jgi:hypothetical protein
MSFLKILEIVLGLPTTFPDPEEFVLAIDFIDTHNFFLKILGKVGF